MIDIEKTLKIMTLEEKAGLCSGLDYWTTKAIPHLGIKSFMMTDGPNGIRKQTGTEDLFGLNASIPTTNFPTGSCLASSWDTNIFYEVGKHIGKEARLNDVSLVLGPAVNIKRSPLGGRNFEYLSEDPLLAGKLASAYVKGMQSMGVGATPKHFAVNNQETRRMTIDAIVDERTLREIYLKVFEIIIKESSPWMLMTSYNRLNGEYTSEKKSLITDILRNDWNYRGLTVTDWFATDNRVAALRAGQDLEMPGLNGLNDREIIKAVNEGLLDESVLDVACGRFLELYNKISQENLEDIDVSGDSHEVAFKAAAASMVLLKNEDAILPLKKGTKIAVMGDFAVNPRIQGGGSSHLNPRKIDTPLDFIIIENGVYKTFFSQGYNSNDDEINETLLEKSLAHAKKVDVVVIFSGLTEVYESEGFDRETLSMPKNHLELIKRVSEVNKNVVVVLQNGAPVEMPWINDVKAVLECYLAGEASGSAATAILFGDVNPSGKLTETFPIDLKDNPSYLNFPGGKDSVHYSEGPFVGYRYYQSKGVKTLFPFGHGLSYTNFEYEDLRCSLDKKDKKNIHLNFKIKNIGTMEGQETAQVYVKAPNSEVVRPEIELKGFTKVLISVQETKEIALTISDLEYWSTEKNKWVLETGEYQILVGSSSEDIRLCSTIYIESDDKEMIYDSNTYLGTILNHPQVGAWAKKIRQKFTLTMTGGIETIHTNILLEKSTLELPLRLLLYTGMISKNQLTDLLKLLNDKTFNPQDLSWLNE